MNVNILEIEETIGKVISQLKDLKTKKNISSIEININKYWMNDYYDTEFKVEYDIGEE